MSTLKEENTALEKAIRLLNQGKPVAIPTETVYGLAAPINNPDSIKKIFSLKERPFFDPLIVHIPHENDLYALIKTPSPAMQEAIEKLSRAFWPGPLTLVLPKDDKIDTMITSGLETVGVRCPSHPLTRALLVSLGVALAAPSANKFGKTSPTSAEHVRSTWTEDEVFVLDGGACEVGIESTVMALVDINPAQNTSNATIEAQILRKGKISFCEIQNVLGPAIKIIEMQSNASPGHTPEHYMPDKPLVVVHEDLSLPASGYFTNENGLQELLRKVPSLDHSTGSIKFAELKLDSKPEIAARTLYAQMRELSAQDIDIIIVQKKQFQTKDIPPTAPDHQSNWIWSAIWDRLNRASTFEIY